MIFYHTANQYIRPPTSSSFHTLHPPTPNHKTSVGFALFFGINHIRLIIAIYEHYDESEFKDTHPAV